MQKKVAFIVLVIFGLMAVACGGEDAPAAVEDVVNTVVEELPIQLEATAVPAEDSPRDEAEASPIPPTYTPQPTAERQFFKPGEGNGITATSGTRGSVTNAEGTRIAIPAGSGTYTVQPGDQLAEIAIEFGVTLDDIICANEISDMNHIEVGQVLIIPFNKN